MDLFRSGSLTLSGEVGILSVMYGLDLESVKI